MRLLPRGSTALLVELDAIEEVLALYDALEQTRPYGVVDLVPATRTLLLVTGPVVTSLPAVAEVVRQTVPRRRPRDAGNCSRCR